MELIDDSVNELKHGHDAYCFKKGQVDEILKRIDAEVTEEDGIFTLKVKG
jgi:hypothetical protein